MNSAAWGASFSGPGLHCYSQSVRTRRSRVYCQRLQAVLAPVEPSSQSVIVQKQSLSSDDSLLQQGGPLQGVARSGRALAGQLLGLLSLNGVLANPEQSFRDAERLRELGGQATERGLQAHTAEEKEAAVKAPPADIRRYLKPTGLRETRYVRMLSSLCNETYYLSKLSARTLWLRHKLRLVTTSHECAHVAKEIPRTAAQTMDEGDAMASTPQQAQTAQKDILQSSQNAVPAMAALEKLKQLDSRQERSLSPAEIVAQRLSMAAAAAANAAAPLANNITSFTSAAASAVPMKAVASQLQVAAAAGQSTAVATIATVTAAVQSTWGSDKAKLSKDNLQNPTEWYVADDPMSHTRYFIIQGSDTLDHWKVNLTFDPVVFEDASLGVKVHRGVYEAAKLLYERYKPMVEEHLATSPFAKIAFIGHSLGGSLGSLLMLMFLHRGVIPVSAISPTYTFGAPAIFCEASGPGGTCALSMSAAPKALPDGKQQSSKAASAPVASKEAASAPAIKRIGHLVMDRPEVADRSLLERMGLPTGAIRNVIMHRDIVPRAFACDYKLVADILARVNDGFREHGCLQNTNGRQVMYYFLGKMFVLQPDEHLSFVKEPYHPMLPPGPGLYTLQEPSLLASGACSVRSAAAAHASEIARLARKGTTHLGNIRPKPASVGKQQRGGSLALFPAKPKAKAQQMSAVGLPAPTLFDAIMELLDNPHPLDMLSEVTAYGPDGGISRYHNPDNYTKALGGVLRFRKIAWRPLLSGRSLADAKGAQQSAPGLEGSLGMATSDLWFNPRTGTQKVKVRRAETA